MKTKEETGLTSMDMDEEAALLAISAAEEELRRQEALAAYGPDDETISLDYLVTRVSEQLMLTFEEAGPLVLAAMEENKEEVICFMLHSIAEREGLELKPHDPCFHPEV
jgi:hypothetical protein